MGRRVAEMGREKSQEGRQLGKTQKQPVYSRRGLTETGFPYAEEAHLREQTPYGPYWDELGLGGAAEVALLTRRSWHAPKEGQEWKSYKTIWGRRDREREEGLERMETLSDGTNQCPSPGRERCICHSH